MIFQTENFMKDNADKVPAEDKPAIEAAIETLKKAKDSNDVAQIDAAIEGLNKAMQTASQKMYAAGAQPGAGAADPGAGFNAGGAGFQGSQQSGPSNQNGDNVQDADFEEVH